MRKGDTYVALCIYAEKKNMYYICHSKPSVMAGRSPDCKQSTEAYSYHLKAFTDKPWNLVAYWCGRITEAKYWLSRSENEF